MKGFHETWPDSPAAARHLAVFINQSGPDEPGRVVFHYHECLELLLLERGQCQLTLEQQTIALEAGDLVLIGAGSSHGIPDMSGCRFLVLQFDPEWLLDLGDGTAGEWIPFLQADANLLAHVTLGDDAPVRDWLDDIASDWRDQPPALNLSIRGSLLKIVAWLIRYSHLRYLPQDLPMQWFRQIQPALRHVRSHYMDPFSETEAAALCHLSAPHFCRIFRKVTGKRFVSYIHHIRLLEARRFLATTDRPVAWIAARVGYASSSHFAAIFKKMTGLTPRGYRKQNQDKSRSNHDTLEQRPAL